MSVINNDGEIASKHANAIKSFGSIDFNPSFNISYSSSPAVSGIEQSVMLASDVVQLFSSLVSKEGNNVQALSDFWVSKDQQIARSQENY